MDLLIEIHFFREVIYSSAVKRQMNEESLVILSFIYD